MEIVTSKLDGILIFSIWQLAEIENGFSTIVSNYRNILISCTTLGNFNQALHIILAIEQDQLIACLQLANHSRDTAWGCF